MYINGSTDNPEQIDFYRIYFSLQNKSYQIIQIAPISFSVLLQINLFVVDTVLLMIHFTTENVEDVVKDMKNKVLHNQFFLSFHTNECLPLARENRLLLHLCKNQRVAPDSVKTLFPRSFIQQVDKYV